MSHVDLHVRPVIIKINAQAAKIILSLETQYA